MDNLSFEKLLFTSAVSVMACDGEIHDDEIVEVKEIINNTPYFLNLDTNSELKTNLENIKKEVKNLLIFL